VNKIKPKRWEKYVNKGMNAGAMQAHQTTNAKAKKKKEEKKIREEKKEKKLLRLRLSVL
jgi:hypothetical protein